MTTLTIAQFLDTIRSCNLLEGAALREAETLAEQSSDADQAVAELVRRQRLTPYQAEELRAGRGAQLVIGSYLLLEPIGAGGMGQVFRARQRVLERECALKIIRKDRLRSDEAVERFLREARLAAKLKHPNIVTIFDANVADGVHYLAMELLEGITLAERVTHGPLSIGQTCRYLRQAALGLQHAYEQGMVHRDIKPQNLFIERSTDQVKILDMGLARVREIAQNDETADGALTREGAVMGTPDYMAPEQALDTRSADHRADIYSLGCTLYFVIAGRPPFAGGSMTEKLLAHQQREPMALDSLCQGVPAGLSGVIRKAMAKLPAQRYQTASEFAAALAPFETSQAIVAAEAAPTISAATMQHRANQTTTEPSLNVAKKPPASSKAAWLIGLTILGVAACCLIVPLGLLATLVMMPGGAHMQPNGGGMVEQVAIPTRKEPPPFRELKRFDGQSFHLSKDGKRLIHGARGKFHVSDFETGKKLFSLPDEYVAHGFVEGNPPRVLASHLGKTLYLFDGDTGKELKKLPLQIEDTFRTCIPRSDGKSAVLQSDRVLRVVNLEDGAEILRIPHAESNILHIAVSESGLFALTATTLFDKHRLQLWSLPTKKLHEEFDAGALNQVKRDISCIALSANLQTFVAGVGKEMFVWNHKEPLPSIVIHGHSKDISCAAVSPDGKWLLSGGKNMTVHFGSTTNGGDNYPKARHDHVVYQVAFHPDGLRALSASEDNTVRVWQLPDIHWKK